MVVQPVKEWSAKVCIDGEWQDLGITEFTINYDYYDQYSYNFSGYPIKKNTEEQKVNKCELELGDIIVAKDGFVDINDGRAVLACPGYSFDDFLVTKTPKGVRVEASGFICEDCGELELQEFFFDFNECFDVLEVKYNVHDGIFVLQVIYDLGEEVEVDDNL